MSNPVGDIRGVPFPRHGVNDGIIPSVVAVPRVRDVPNVVSQEVLLAAVAALPANTANFTSFTNVNAVTLFSFVVSENLRVRLNALYLQCTDLVPAAAVYLQMSLQLDGQPMGGWGLVSIFPEGGAAKLSLDMDVEIQPKQTLTALARNTDAVNQHALWMYLYGWQYPADYQDGQG